MLREYIYNGESEKELKTRLKNIFGDGCLSDCSAQINLAGSQKRTG